MLHYDWDPKQINEITKKYKNRAHNRLQHLVNRLQLTLIKFSFSASRLMAQVNRLHQRKLHFFATWKCC